MTDLVSFDRIGPGEVASVGGKALSLALLTSAGLPVPPGFCLTTGVRRLDDALATAVGAAYLQLGEGPVAVRSSATAEDGAVTSFAGQQETILGVKGLDAVLRAVERCWASLDSDRAVAYRRRQGLGDDGHAMAVVVQKLVPAEVAGVLFTRDPLHPTDGRMLVEASWGLGETVVSGRVTPDRFHLDRDTGQVADRHVATKAVMRSIDGEQAVPVEKQSIACLDDAQLARLAELGRRVEAYHGEPRDVEWAFADGQFWLLQSRPITASGRAEREQVRLEEIAALKAKASPRGTVWARFNLSEVLPAPTPMTWAIVSRRLMSGMGGFGLMYRDLGFDPHPALDDAGVFDLVCGRPYCNLSREARMHDRHLPLGHPFAALKADPRRALYPAPTVTLEHFRLTTPLMLPWVVVKSIRGAFRRRRLLKTFAHRFREEIAPAFLREVRAACEQDLTKLDEASLLGFLDAWMRKTLVDFARDSLKPTALAALAMAGLEQKLAAVLGQARAGDLTRDLVMGVRPEPDADLAGGVQGLVRGELSREAFLARFGHRGHDEMELSSPRWAEDSTTLPQTSSATRAAHEVSGLLSPESRLLAESRLNAEQRALVLRDLPPVREYVALRESAKHHLMAGYFLIRKALLEIDRRAGLHGGVFYLMPEEFSALTQGSDVSAVIAQRRRRRMLALGLEVPTVLFSDDLDAIGRPVVLEGAESLQGSPLSAGVAEAPALVLEEPNLASAPSGDYILVCPSTDPAWVPLFVRARGLVMETGGVLSHGAIVAREFGLPAVAGLPGLMRRVRTGQRLRVDGGQGTVALLD